MARRSPTSMTTVGSMVLADAASAATVTRLVVNGATHLLDRDSRQAVPEVCPIPARWRHMQPKPRPSRLKQRSSLDNIQGPVADHADSFRRDEKIEGTPSGCPVSQVGPGDLERRPLDGSRGPDAQIAGVDAHTPRPRPIHYDETDSLA